MDSGDSSGISRYLPRAGAAAIVRANQKDDYYINELTTQVVEVLRSIKGSLFVHNHRTDIAGVAKFIYFVVTTGIGARTLGEEYVDLRYVSRNGKRRVGITKRMLFLFLYVLVPYLMSKLKNTNVARSDKIKKILSKLTFFNVLDFMNLHMALFYFSGKYYQLSKRMLGMRYVLNYIPDPRSGSNGGNYEYVGAAMALQLMVKYSGILKNKMEHLWKSDRGNIQNITLEEKKVLIEEEISKGTFTQLVKMKLNDDSDDASVKTEEFNVTVVDLADPTQLMYLPEQSRSCMLCLSLMKDPSCTTCGHLFCWGCIQNWCKERTECPLCRAPIAASQTLPLR